MKIHVHNNYDKCNAVENFYTYILSEIQSGDAFLNLIIIILACSQAYVVIRRIYFGIKSLMTIKEKLENEEENFNFRENSRVNNVASGEAINSNSEDDIKSIFVQGRTKWEMLKLSEKKKFFNLWHGLILTANFFQLISAINHILFPILTFQNQFYCSLSCLLTYFSLGHIFEYEDKYYFFYLTIKKSIKTHVKYLLVFFLIFIGFVLLVGCCFHYSKSFYSNFHVTMITVFASMTGDSLLDVYNSTLDKDPLKTIVFGFFFFLCFIAFLLRMLVIVAEESFESIRMKNHYYWLDQKISIEDYIKNEIDLRNDCENDRDHYMLSDFFIQQLLDSKNLNQNENKFTLAKDGVNIQDIVQVDKEKLEADGIYNEEVVKHIKKKFKETIKNSINNDFLNEVFSVDKTYDPHGTELKLRTDTLDIKNTYKSFDNIFDKIESTLDKIDLIITQKNKNIILTDEDKKEILKNVIEFADKIILKLINMKQSLKE
jgi:hypothetical protein